MVHLPFIPPSDTDSGESIAERGRGKGPVRLSQLFGGKRDLIVIHNMGSQCPYCTLWADGYNGLYSHLVTRAAFVVASPDPPAVQRRFARSRGWRFLMVSHHGSTFAADMGYRSRQGGFLPGLSGFRRTRDGVTRVSDAGFQPGSEYYIARQAGARRRERLDAGAPPRAMIFRGPRRGRPPPAPRRRARGTCTG